MRNAILLTRKHGSKSFELHAGPEFPFDEATKYFNKALLANGVHPEIAELQCWHSDVGVYRTLKFNKPEDEKARHAKIAADLAAHEEEVKNPGKKAKAAKAAAKAAADEAAKAAAPEAPYEPTTDL